MDYFVGFLFGYYLKKFFTWLDKFADRTIEKNMTDREWDWI